MNNNSIKMDLLPTQLFALLFLIIMGTGLIALPGTVVGISGQDGWISLLLSGGVALVTLNVLLFFLKFFPDKTFVEISEMFLGKYLGKLPPLMIFVFYMAFTAVAIRTMVDLVSTWLLPNTPIEVLTISLLILCCYGIRNGLKVVGRFSEVTAWLILPIFLLFFVPPIYHNNVMAIFPIGGSGLTRIVQATIPAFYAFTGYESILLLYPYIRKKAEHKRIVLICNGSLLLAIFLKFVVIFGSILTFGAPEVKYFIYPLLEYFKLINFPIIERVEFALVYFWIFIFFGAILVLFYLATTTLEQSFKFQGYKNTSILLSIPMYYIFRFPQNVAEIANKTFTQVGILGLVLSWLILISFTILALIRGRRSNA